MVSEQQERVYAVGISISNVLLVLEVHVGVRVRVSIEVQEVPTLLLVKFLGTYYVSRYY